MNALKLTKQSRSLVPSGILSGVLIPESRQLIAGCMDGVYVTGLDELQQPSAETTSDPPTDLVDQEAVPAIQPAALPPRKLYSHASYVSSVQMVGDSTIVSAGYDGWACWYDLQEEREVRRIKLHDFWSWDMAVSPDRRWLASVTGQYLAGGYKYEPMAEREPSLRILDAQTGQLVHSLPHVPSVQAVAISPDSQYVAAGNLMGEIRVYRIEDGQLVSHWTTPDFTSWGIIKSHCYLGGIFAMHFTPDGSGLLLAGMGPMRDPMAGNGRQLWQLWDWQQATPSMRDQTHPDEAGEGLMETLAIDRSGKIFAMGGRLRGGDWNVALFDLTSGSRLATLKTNCRVTQALFSQGEPELILCGAQEQPKEKVDGRFPDFGRIDVYTLEQS